LLISSGVAWMRPALARASTTLVSVSCSKLASPLTVATMLGIRSARRWYWLSTSDQAALTCFVQALEVVVAAAGLIKIGGGLLGGRR
jgi:hypothetical protein